jgi:putative ABC transport system substrate-binding protein
LRRRQFISLLGGAAAAWPIAARAQQPAMPVVGYLYAGFPEPSAHLVAAFRKGLSETGYVEGRNLTVEYRWAESRYDRLPGMAADLVRRGVTVIFASPGLAGQAAKAATTTIPIVFTTGIDPIDYGLVTSLNRPDGNLTGVSNLSVELGPKRLELLHDLVPKATTIGYLVNPTNPAAEAQSRDAQAAARSLGLRLLLLEATSERDLDAAFATLLQQQAGALLMSSDPTLTNRSEQIAALAVRHAMPAMFTRREGVAAGGLASYGASVLDAARQAGLLTGRILKGEKPADLPVVQSTKFEFVINLQTTRALGVTVPPSLLAIADEVIE